MYMPRHGKEKMRTSRDKGGHREGRDAGVGKESKSLPGRNTIHLSEDTYM